MEIVLGDYRCSIDKEIEEVNLVIKLKNEDDMILNLNKQGEIFDSENLKNVTLSKWTTLVRPKE